MPVVKECRSGWPGSASTAVIQVSSWSPCRPVRILANPVTCLARASSSGQRPRRAVRALAAAGSRRAGSVRIQRVTWPGRGGAGGLGGAGRRNRAGGAGEDPAGARAGAGGGGRSGRGGQAEQAGVAVGGAVAAAVSAGGDLAVQGPDRGAALLPPLVQVRFPGVQAGCRAGGGQQGVSGGGAPVPAGDLPAQAERGGG